VPQRYAPDGIERGDLYRPGGHGHEPDLQGWLDRGEDA
jgi:hypothetical protein